MTAICGCAKPVSLSVCLPVWHCLLTLCVSVCGGDYYRVCQPLSVPTRLTHAMPHVHTQSYTQSYVSEAEEYQLYQGQSPTTERPLIQVHIIFNCSFVWTYYIQFIV